MIVWVFRLPTVRLADEEHSKVANFYDIHSSGSWLTPFIPQVFDVVYESGRTFGTPSTLMGTTWI